MSADSEGREGTRDLDLTPEDAERIKGGRLDPGPGGAFGQAQLRKKRRKRRSNKNEIGPYQGKH